VFPRPRFRLPLWAAFAVTAAAYLVRSAMRGFDFKPDLPNDALALIALFVVVGLVAWTRSQNEADAPDDDLESGEHDASLPDDSTKGPAA
jgi:hypothetical protein